MLRASSEARITRMDLPFLLGTALTEDRARAKAFGYMAHFMFGFAFALGYFAIFSAVGRSGWLFGAALGFLHGVFAATALVNALLPTLHPRMGTGFTAADDTALLEPPGFLMLNYGRGTPLVTIVAHVAYGAIVGGFTSVSR
jgi:hypothetical protein